MTLRIIAKFTSTTQFSKHLFSVNDGCADFKKLGQIVEAIDQNPDFKFKPAYMKIINDRPFITLIVDGLKYSLKNSDRGNIYSFTPEFRRIRGKDGKHFLNIYAKDLKLMKKREVFEPAGELVSFDLI